VLRHEYDIINDVTNRRTVGTFLEAPYWTRTPKSLNFRDIYSIKVADRHTDRHVD